MSEERLVDRFSMTKKLIKTKKRVKEQGEVFTPDWLIKNSFDKIPTNLFKDSSITFIDPACGNGNFLVEVVKIKILLGSSKWEALSTTFGIDIMEDNVIECRQRLLQVVDVKQKRFEELVKTTIVCGNSLKQSTDELFKDYVDKYKKDA